ncbi:isopenicillin N synthase family dioxygenase [Nocardia sp. NBC_01327]|uniref:isopenicillin N synthase family dioxygenase n=1 Tax=Nocardia sp. NBC_01327 TaxID=2903593 RepID=UPI002E145E31|nr:isopenicillin N synthase family oxygenase [Nocardia sp. NBC_01327]
MLARRRVSGEPHDQHTRFQVPVIDIGPYTGLGDPSKQGIVARELDHALRTVGFLQITNHGVPEEVIAGLARSIDEFFALPPTTKLAYRTRATGNRGYSPPRSEALSLSAGITPASRMNDFFEAFNIGAETGDYPAAHLPAEHYADNVWPTESGEFRSAVTDYYAEAARVARTLTTIFADALGVAPGFFTEYTDHSIDVLRMNNYALPAGEITVDGDLNGMGEHTDFGIVTVLWADAAPGLQVLGADQHWHDVQPAPGALLVNLGDLMSRWTSDRWLSTLHRVKPPVQDGKVLRRRSAAFFHDGNSDALITTIPSCLDQHSPGYPPITVDAHITAKLNGSRGGVINTGATREAARILAAQGVSK